MPYKKSVLSSADFEFAVNREFEAVERGFNDPESGSWTPGIAFGGGSTGITYSALNTGKYVKVGKSVMVTFRVELTSKGSSTGTASLTGLPFATSSSEARGGCAVGYYGFMAAGVNTSVTLLTEISATTAVFFYGTATTSTPMTHAEFTNTSVLLGSFVYEAQI